MGVVTVVVRVGLYVCAGMGACTRWVHVCCGAVLLMNIRRYNNQHGQHGQRAALVAALVGSGSDPKLDPDL